MLHYIAGQVNCSRQTKKILRPPRNVMVLPTDCAPRLTSTLVSTVYCLRLELLTDLFSETLQNQCLVFRCFAFTLTV